MRYVEVWPYRLVRPEVHPCHVDDAVFGSSFELWTIEGFPEPLPATWQEASEISRQLEDQDLEEAVFQLWHVAWGPEAQRRVQDLVGREVIPPSQFNHDAITVLRSQRVKAWVAERGSDDDQCWLAAFYGARPRQPRRDAPHSDFVLGIGPVEIGAQILEWAVAGSVGGVACHGIAALWRKRPRAPWTASEILSIPDSDIQELARWDVENKSLDEDLILLKSKSQVSEVFLGGKWVEEQRWTFDFADSSSDFTVSYVLRSGDFYPRCVTTERRWREDPRESLAPMRDRRTGSNGLIAG